MNELNTHWWNVGERDGRWYCEQYSNEVMRLGADGSLGVGGNLTPIRSYPFLTAEWAYACLHRMQEMDRAFEPQPEYSTMLTFNALNRPYAFAQVEFQSTGRQVIRIGQNGVLEYVNLPLIVWAWLRNTRFVRGLKRFWYGERGQA